MLMPGGECGVSSRRSPVFIMGQNVFSFSVPVMRGTPHASLSPLKILIFCGFFIPQFFC